MKKKVDIKFEFIVVTTATVLILILKLVCSL